MIDRYCPSLIKKNRKQQMICWLMLIKSCVPHHRPILEYNFLRKYHGNERGTYTCPLCGVQIGVNVRQQRLKIIWNMPYYLYINRKTADSRLWLGYHPKPRATGLLCSISTGLHPILFSSIMCQSTAANGWPSRSDDIDQIENVTICCTL